MSMLLTLWHSESVLKKEQNVKFEGKRDSFNGKLPLYIAMNYQKKPAKAAGPAVEAKFRTNMSNIFFSSNAYFS